MTGLFQQILKGTAQWVLCCFLMHNKVSGIFCIRFRDDSIVQSVLRAGITVLTSPNMFCWGCNCVFLSPTFAAREHVLLTAVLFYMHTLAASIVCVAISTTIRYVEDNHFHCVVIDECAQVSSAWLWCGLSFGLIRLLLNV